MTTEPTMSRRGFMASGLGMAALGAVPRDFLRDPSSVDAWRAHRILVVLQLSGGNDVLSTFVPYADDAYARARRATRIDAKEVLRIDDRIGLHPALKGLRRLLDEGAFAAVLGIGYPEPSFSHFTAMDIWHAGDRRGRAVPQGWIGRYADGCQPNDEVPELAIAIGSDVKPRAIAGARHPGLSFRRPEAFRFAALEGAEEAAYRELNRAPAASAQGNRAHVARSAALAIATSERLRAIARGHRARVEYPNTPLAASLRTVAALVTGGARTRVYYVFQGGYDTHAGQKPRHDRLMGELDAAVAAFQLDLARHGTAERVLTMAFSEFGRRVAENGSGGTDHGAAGGMFLVGPGVVPGLHGKMPSLTELHGGGGGSLAYTIDFRCVYAAVLRHWLGTDSRAIVGDFPPVGCIARRSV
jgi:uncharacterized protein (DUF1501 family)